MVNAPVEENVEFNVAVNAPVTAAVPVTFKAVPLHVKFAESANKPLVLAKVTRPLVKPLFVTDVAVTEVNAPVVAVVAPTVPLILIEAVPVRLVTVPLEGVPNTPPLTTTAPAEPTLTAKAVATLVPKPLTPVEIGRPVALVSVADVGVPNIGVISVGLVANTFAPVPVSSVSAAAKFAELGVAKNVATLVPKPLMPVETGRPVALVSVADEGVPNAGVTNVGLVAKTKEPVPVSSVTAAIKFEEEGVAKKVATPVPKPLMPVATGRPVALVNVADDGVPKAGVTSVGLVANTNEPLPVSSVTAAAKLAEEGVAKRVATPVPNPLMPVDTGSPVALVRVTEEGVPSAGVTSVGLVDITTLPVPVMALLTRPLEASVNTA